MAPRGHGGVTMMRRFSKGWRAVAWGAPTLGLLLFSGVAMAEPPNISSEGPEGPTAPSDLAEGPSTTSPTNVPHTVSSSTPSQMTQNLSVRQVSPDMDKVKQVTGPVVKQEGLNLYVQDVSGLVVPLDMSALQVRKMPREGQEVVALYEVQGNLTNVALSIQGEKLD